MQARTLQQYVQRCGCRKGRPCCSGGTLVFVKESAESIVSADA
jgi:hypothetical protein